MTPLESLWVAVIVAGGVVSLAAEAASAFRR